jgi:tetratricopeptide (TPR) repeat protein
MKSTRSKPAPRVPRRWRTPPPLTRGSESLEGMEILREIGGDTGILLWQAYRNVMFWASVEQGERSQLFSDRAAQKREADLADARVADELREPLAAFARMLADPDGTPGEAVADACTEVARWAEAEGHLNTALSYTQAAAVAAQRNARLSLAVGQLARRRGDLARAETWFRHTIMIGRQVGDWDSYSRAYIALGNMLIEKGNLPAAGRMHIKALRAARRKGLQQLQGMALHDLFVIAHETGRFDQAEEYARQAFRAYGPLHPMIPALAMDIGYIWLERGSFQRALDVFQALEAHMQSPRHRLILLANMARAAGGVGNRELFRRAWTQAYRMNKDPELQAVAPACMLDLGFGAAHLGEWDRAEQAAQEAYEQATRLGQGKIRLRAESLLDSIKADRGLDNRPVTAPKASPRSDALAGELVRTLATAPVGV